MRVLGQFFGWAAVVCAALLFATGSLTQADPTDDFSLTLARANEFETYSLMSEMHVADIFADHLDLYPKSQTPKLARHLLELCERFRFDPAFVLSLIQVESGFRVRAVSEVGAVGLMQVMPSTAERIAAGLGLRNLASSTPMERALLDPFMNLSVGVAYLAYLRDRYLGLSPYYLVAAYSIGPSLVDELLARPSFKPVLTKKYYEAIRRGVPGFRFCRNKNCV